MKEFYGNLYNADRETIVEAVTILAEERGLHVLRVAGVKTGEYVSAFVTEKQDRVTKVVKSKLVSFSETDVCGVVHRTLAAQADRASTPDRPTPERVA